MGVTLNHLNNKRKGEQTMDDVRMEYSVERGTWNVMVNAEWYYEGYFDHALQVFESFFWNDDQHEVNQGYNEY